MTPINYCYEKIASQGSPIYYCIKKIDKSKRDAVAAVFAFYEELNDIILQGTDFQVSSQRMNWWRNEILFNNPTHPVLIALKEQKVNPEKLLNLLTGMEENLSLSRFDTFEAVVIQIMRTVGARELLIAEILEIDVEDEMIFQFSIVLEITNYLQFLRQYIRQGLIFFPEDEMRQYKVTEESLRYLQTTPEIKNLLQDQFEKAERSYRKAMDDMGVKDNHSLAYLIARCKMALATLDEIKRSGFAVLEQYIQLTPLRMWWIAYRN